jgi:hypothetical protein
MYPELDARGAEADERVAADVLFGTLYAELHRLARRELYRHGPIGGWARPRCCTRPTCR